MYLAHTFTNPMDTCNYFQERKKIFFFLIANIFLTAKGCDLLLDLTQEKEMDL